MAVWATLRGVRDTRRLQDEAAIYNRTRSIDGIWSTRSENGLRSHLDNVLSRVVNRQDRHLESDSEPVPGEL
jgi:hypothetical protein